MPPEPKKPVEKLLEASAKTRREAFGADPMMPNPMRARLHDEIARQNRAEAAASRSASPFAWWPRLVIGAAVALVIGAPLIWWKAHQSDSEARPLARNESVAPSEADAVGEPIPTQPPLIASAPQPAAPAPPAAMAAGSRQQFSRTAARQQSFSRTSREQAPNLLSNFELEQTGDQVRVRDADGSTYIGNVESDSAAPRSETTERAKAADGQVSQFRFRASGYNATLKKHVVFEGHYTETPAFAEGEDGKARENRSGSPSAARVVGNATINGEARVPVEAVAVER